MAYVIDIPAPLRSLMEGFPLRTRAAIHGTLDRMARWAEFWEPGDARWERLARHDGQGLHFYADGCCVRVELQPGVRRLALREIGRVLVHLPGGWRTHGQDVVGSHLEH
jgi:hypothetical protein